MGHRQEIKEILDTYDKEDKLFFRSVDLFLRNYDFLIEDYIEAKWIILKDINAKLAENESAWDIYDNPRLFCESVVSKYNVEYIGIKGRFLKRILPNCLTFMIIVFLFISPNGISQLFNLNNRGLIVNVQIILLIALSILNYCVPLAIHNDNLFVRHARLPLWPLFIYVIYAVLFYNFRTVLFDNRYAFTIHPLYLFIVLLLLGINYFMNRNKLFY